MDAQRAVLTAMYHYKALTKDGKDYAAPIAAGLSRALKELHRLEAQDVKIDGIIEEKRSDLQAWEKLRG